MTSHTKLKAFPSVSTHSVCTKVPSLPARGPQETTCGGCSIPRYPGEVGQRLLCPHISHHILMQASTFMPLRKFFIIPGNGTPQHASACCRLLNTQRLEGWWRLTLTIWPWAGHSECHAVECNGVSAENIQIWPEGK